MPTPKPHKWENYSDERLLDVRLCDLKLTLKGSPVEKMVETLKEELKSRRFRFLPHFWVGDEWFSPDGVPGIAIPFYLLHPRLARLERNQVFHVEGGTERHCLKILRHEAGHVYDTAYRLHRKARYRELFGRASIPYPDSYKPQPLSKNYVIHFDFSYAQSHPVEDFAETFAVWLGYKKRWRNRYANWPKALKKLEYMNELMNTISSEPAPVRSRQHIDPISKNTQTLRDHYEQKRERYGLREHSVLDSELRKLFERPEIVLPVEGTGEPLITPSQFFRRHRKLLRDLAAHWTGEHHYTIDQIIEEMMIRARQLRLAPIQDSSQRLQNSLAMLVTQVMNYMHSGKHRIAL